MLAREFQAVEITSGYFGTVYVSDKAVIVPDVQRQRSIVGVNCEWYADIARSVSGIHLIQDVKSNEVLVTYGPLESDAAWRAAAG